MGGVEEWRIKPSQLSTKLKLKLKLSLAIAKGDIQSSFLKVEPQNLID